MGPIMAVNPVEAGAFGGHSSHPDQLINNMKIVSPEVVFHCKEQTMGIGEEIVEFPSSIHERLSPTVGTPR
jgi:hypothetical protein